MRGIRWLDAVAEDIARALPNTADAVRFATVDWPITLEALSRPGVVEDLETGAWPGGRLVVEPGRTVGAYNVFAALVDGEVLILGIDIWPNGFPDE